MTVATYSTAWSNNTSAGFQSWGSALSAAMQACGLTQTTDTGQINWTTVTVPSANNTVAGYEIYKFTDTLQSTYPIYVKIEYGSGANQANNFGSPAIWITVGQGSNGAGTLTGTLTTRNQIMCNNSGQGARVIGYNTISFPTFVCFNGSYLGVALKVGGLYNTYSGQNIGGCMFTIGRAVDSTGAYVGGKIMCCWNGSDPASVGYGTCITYCINTVTATVYTENNGYFSMVPFGVTSSAVSGAQFQVYPTWGMYNQVLPNLWLLYGLTQELQLGATITATPIGTNAHTYLMTGMPSSGWGLPSNTSYAMLMMWE